MTGNRRELQKARRIAREASESLAAILRLPRRKHARVLWGNGVVWERYGDDDWRPVGYMREGVLEAALPADIDRRYSSAHIASTEFEVMT